MGAEQLVTVEADVASKFAEAQADIDARGEAYFIDKYGLGAEELLTEVEYGDFRGPLHAALDDGYDPAKDAHRRRCPVGGEMQRAFETKGVAGVERKLRGLAALADTKIDAAGNEVDRFKVVLTDKTKERATAAALKKKMGQSPTAASAQLQLIPVAANPA